MSTTKPNQINEENAMQIDNLILAAQRLNNNISGLTEEQPTEKVLEEIQKVSYLVSSLLDVIYEKNILFHQTLEYVWDLQKELKDSKVA